MSFDKQKINSRSERSGCACNCFFFYVFVHILYMRARVSECMDEMCSVRKRTVMRYLCNDTCVLYWEIVPSLHSPICGRCIQFYTIALYFFSSALLLTIKSLQPNGIGSFCCYWCVNVMFILCLYVYNVQCKSWTHAKQVKCMRCQQ